MLWYPSLGYPLEFGNYYLDPDHFLCSSVVDGLIDKVNILHEFITSDHKPVFVTFRGMKGSLQAPTAPQQDSITV